jgi:hypothetical protein
MKPRQFAKPARPKVAAIPAPPPASDDRKQIFIRLSPAQRKRLKQLAIEEDTTVQALAFGALSALFVERGLPPLVDGRATS